MSVEIPLKAVYQRVDTNEDEEKSIQLDDSSSTNISKEASVCSESSSIEPCPRRAKCVKLFACIGVTVTVVSMFWLLLVLAVSIRAYSSLNNCFHSESYLLQESIINTTVNRIQFSVITGFVHIEFHEGSNIEVRLYDRFRSYDRIDKSTIVSSIKQTNGSILIHSESPAFNFYSCQHASVEILIPASYSSPIAISGFVNTGMVKIKGEDGVSLSNIDIIVQAGKVDIHEVVAKSISVSSDLGCVTVKHSISSSDIKLLVKTGSIKTHDLITKDLQAVTQYGRSIHHDIVADKVHVETKWGYSHVYESSPLSAEQKIELITEYGNNLLYISSPKVDFNLDTIRGYMVVDYEDQLWDCKVKNFTHSLLNGQCTPSHTSDSNTHSKISLKTTYGSSNLVIDSEEEEL